MEIENSNNLISKKDFMNKRRYIERRKFINEKSKELPKSYLSDINMYKNYCFDTEQEESIESMLDFLYISVLFDKVKISTWLKRYYAVKKYLETIFDITLDKKTLNEVNTIKTIYKDEDNAYLTLRRGKSSVDKQELLDLIINLDTRERAITMVNLITASRPSEMVRLKMKHFDLEERNLSVYLLKQREWQHKRLDLETVKAVKEYKDIYRLGDNDYFVGRQDRHGKFSPVKVSETGYRKMLKRWTGLSPYNLRKTQVSSMHVKGADLPSISKQTGHKSIQTISEHYLKVSDKTIDKYL